MANEKRLIDANALKKRLSDLEAHGGHNYYRQGMDDALHTFMPHFIDEAPTVDAVEDDFQEIRIEQAYCNGKAVMRQAVLRLLEAEMEVHRGSDRSLIRYLIKKIERLEAASDEDDRMEGK